MELDIRKLEEHKLTPDEFVFLHFLVYPSTTSVLGMLVVDYDKLEKKALIKIGPDETYYSRKAAINLVSVEERISKDQKPDTPKEQPVRNDNLIDSVRDWIPDWRTLFPLGVKTGGYSVRGTRGGCIKKMKSFIRKHPKVTKEQIFEATRKYISEKQIANFAYMKIADYFIEKEGGSLLEEYVEGLKSPSQQDLIFPNVQLNTGDLTDDI